MRHIDLIKNSFSLAKLRNFQILTICGCWSITILSKIYIFKSIQRVIFILVWGSRVSWRNLEIWNVTDITEKGENNFLFLYKYIEKNFSIQIIMDDCLPYGRYYTLVEFENWKSFVATVCESFQSGNQTWRTEDGLLWTSFSIHLSWIRRLYNR